MRGRLIQKFFADIRRLDTAAMESTDPDGTGPATGGFDEDFREEVYVDSDGDGIGESSRIEMAAVKVPCQIDRRPDDKAAPTGEGNASTERLKLAFHFRDLERLGLVSPEGRPLISAGTRLAALYEKDESTLVEEYPDPPGMFVMREQQSGFGLSMRGPKRNLFIVTFESEPQGTRVTG